MLIDTHAHLYWDSFKEDFDQVIQRALDAEVTNIINVGVDIEKSRQALEQAEDLAKIPNLAVYSTVGIHPHESSKYFSSSTEDSNVSIQKDIDRLGEIYHSDTSKVVAVGECGLDFAFANNPDFIPSSTPSSKIQDLQHQLFQAQIDLAKKLNLPILVHCRDDRSKNPQNSETWDEVIEMTKDHFGIYHCYSGLLPTTNYILLIS